MNKFKVGDKVIFTAPERSLAQSTDKYADWHQYLHPVPRPMTIKRINENAEYKYMIEECALSISEKEISLYKKKQTIIIDGTFVD